MKHCTQCEASFEVIDEDRKFYEKIGVPTPKECPQCRQRNRLSWINQTKLYKRKCDLTDENLLSMYSKDSPLKVYSQKIWWSDQWDGLDYGRDFDFNRPFFEQWYDLMKLVPRPALFNAFEFNENCDYANHSSYGKNCYMIFDADYNQDCYYGVGINKSKDCMDCSRIKNCELCYECTDCVDGYKLFFSQDTQNCSNSAFLKNCIGVKNSFMCSNLKNKEYYIYNQPSNKETYEKLMLSLSKRSELEKYMKEWSKFKLHFPQKYIHGTQNQNVSGDYLVYCKNAHHCYDSMELEDCTYFVRAFGDSKDCMDCDECGDNTQLIYNCVMSGHGANQLRMSANCINNGSNLDYCYYVMSSQDCFGCVGLKRKKYCILNKQYSKDGYEKLVPKIIEHMKKRGEWGKFFPFAYSDFAYNESQAQDYYPLEKESAKKYGYRWKERDQKDYLPATAQIPDDSHEANESLCKEILSCETCSRNYKIITQELKFYQKQHLPLPSNCFYCRNKNRYQLRNSRILFKRSCNNCEKEIQTTYVPDQPEKVYCEECYLKNIY